MPGSKAGKKKEEWLLPPKEKKKASSDDKAMGQKGKALAAAIRGSYSYSTVASWHMKAQIAEEFHKRNALEQDNAKVQENQRIYQKYHNTHGLRQLARNRVFDTGEAVAPGNAYSESKNQLEKRNRGDEGKVLRCSAQGDSSDYDTEADEKIKKVRLHCHPYPPRHQHTL